MRRIFATAFAAAAVLVAAPAALAAPAGTLSKTTTTWKWTGSAYGINLVGEPCNTDHSCEDLLMEVKNAGDVNVQWTATAPAGPAWIDMTVYSSDASGKTGGDEMASGGGLQDSGGLGAYLDPGFYLVHVEGLGTTLADYEATATLEPDPAVP